MGLNPGYLQRSFLLYKLHWGVDSYLLQNWQNFSKKQPTAQLLVFHIAHFLPPKKPLKDEIVVARNRFLAESMLNGGQSQLKKSPLPKTAPVQSSPIGPRKYSVPTCHTTLKQMEQAKLAREFVQQRKSLNNNNNTDYETGLANLDFYQGLKNPDSGSLYSSANQLMQPEPDVTSAQANNSGSRENLPKLKRTLSRTSSVGKLVNNFETGAGGFTSENSHGLKNPESGFYGSASQQAMAFSYIKPKPPLAAKPSLRHTVSPLHMTFSHMNNGMESFLMEYSYSKSTKISQDTYIFFKF